MNQNSITIDISFETLLQAAQKLSAAQKHLLVQSLHMSEVSADPTRAELIAELQTLQDAGAFFQTERLCNKFAQETSNGLDDEQLLADIRAAATEWENEGFCNGRTLSRSNSRPL